MYLFFLGGSLAFVPGTFMTNATDLSSAAYPTSAGVSLFNIGTNIFKFFIYICWSLFLLIYLYQQQQQKNILFFFYIYLYFDFFLGSRFTVSYVLVVTDAVVGTLTNLVQEFMFTTYNTCPHQMQNLGRKKK